MYDIQMPKIKSFWRGRNGSAQPTTLPSSRHCSNPGPAFFSPPSPSPISLPSLTSCPLGRHPQILTSPANPTLAALLPSRLVTTWWHPSLCGPLSVCTTGKSWSRVECTFNDDAPDAETIWVGVAASEKMSVLCAGALSLALGGVMILLPS